MKSLAWSHILKPSYFHILLIPFFIEAMFLGEKGNELLLDMGSIHYAISSINIQAIFLQGVDNVTSQSLYF